jgi:hypothetical protein
MAPARTAACGRPQPAPARPEGRALDPDGRLVELTDERWAHIVGGHPELAPHLFAVVGAIRAPPCRLAGRHDGEEWFYAEGAGPSRFLKVVVAYDGGRGVIITAFARRSMP